jgi:hypothetical protein
MWYVYIMEYYSAIKKNEIISLAGGKAASSAIQICSLSLICYVKLSILPKLCASVSLSVRGR